MNARSILPPSAINSHSVDIVADDRERASGVIPFLGSIPQVSVRIERLSSGDYLADQRILFERKTLQDFAVSIVDGRLFKQTLALTRSKFRPVLILEGGGKDAEGLGVRREALQGALVTISLIFNIPILRSITPEETARLIVYAARQVRSFYHVGRERPGYRPKGRQARQLFILQGLPGVGRDRALRLLEKFGSVEAVMCAGREELLAVEGVGAKTADRIRWAVCEKLERFGKIGFTFG
ncbi:MAG: ERCC4 domain-containing protein [Desulfobacterales bacterium]